MEPEAFRALVELDDRHWWFAGRRRIIHAQLSRLDLPSPAEVLDAGCGSGRTMDDLRRYGRVRGFDLNELGVRHARARGHEDVHVARVEEIPYPDESFDLVTCLDVIEHTRDDVRSLRELLRVTRPGGMLVATVPAYQALWSYHDEVNQHFRRYRRSTFRRAAVAAGWEPVTWSYFNAILLAPAAAVRLSARVLPDRGRDRSDLRMTPPSAGVLLEAPMRVEAAAIRHGVRLPAGLSLMTVLRRPRSREHPVNGAASAGRSVAAPL
jgi:SAM-dependent methyltransferase